MCFYLYKTKTAHFCGLSLFYIDRKFWLGQLFHQFTNCLLLEYLS